VKQFDHRKNIQIVEERNESGHQRHGPHRPSALRAALGAAERQSDDPRAGNRLEVVHLNELKGGAAATAHLLAFDSVQGKWRADIAAEGDDCIRIDDRRLGFSAHAGSAEIPWGELGVDVVLECTGKFLTPETLQGHLDRGAKRVIVAAPVKVGGVLNIVVGINHEQYEPARDRIVTAASCTTNCLAPVVKVIHENLGIRHGQITTIHDPTNTNLVVDAPHKDLRRARSAMMSLAPTTTGSATAIALIYPELKGKLNGHAVRAGAQRVAHRLRVRAAARHHGGRGERPRRRGQGRAGRHPGLRGAPAGERRLRPRHPQRHRRCAVDDGHRRHPAQGLRLVRQRDGLRLPDGGPGLPHGISGDLMQHAARNYAIVTAAYWGFTLTDGALRMLVLLHFYRLGYSPFTLAFLFLLYEAAGVVANLIGGWLATRYGITRMLAVGLVTQIAGFTLLSMLQPGWTA
jgi:glyceraldehyde-3-phosphate dehydrogenase type I